LAQKIHPLPSFLSQDKKSNFLLEQIKFILLKMKIKNLHRTTPSMRFKSFAII